MQFIDASQWSKFQQALLSWGIRIGVVAALAGLDFLSKSITSGALQLPWPVISLPLVGSAISEADTWLVKWEQTPPAAAAAVAGQ